MLVVLVASILGSLRSHDLSLCSFLGTFEVGRGDFGFPRRGPEQQT